MSVIFSGTNSTFTKMDLGDIAPFTSRTLNSVVWIYLIIDTNLNLSLLTWEHSKQLAKSFKKWNAPCHWIMTMDKTKNVLPSLKHSVHKMLSNNAVYLINCPQCESSYVGQTTRRMQQSFKDPAGSKGPIRTH